MHKYLLAFLLLILAAPVVADSVTLEHNGVTLIGELVKNGDDWTSKPVILMTHGTLAHNQMEIMATLQQAFADRDFSSLAITLSLGLSNRTGMYDCPTPHNHKHTDAITEIGQWQQWLTDQGADTIILLGHSRGGNQTGWYASTLPEETTVKGVVLIAPATWSAEYTAKDYEKRYNTELAPLVEKAGSMVANGEGNEVLTEVGFIYCENTSVTAASFANYYADDERMDTPAVLQQVTLPTLVFAGSKDTVVADLQEKMTELDNRDNIKLVVLDGADHFFRDLYAEDLADEVVDFIESL